MLDTGHMLDRAPRILLVDDEQSIQTLLSYPLRKDGYEVVQANDGQEALARFDETSFGFNTQAAPELYRRQFELMQRLLAETSIDLYCYVTFTSPDGDAVAAKMNAFVDRLQDIDANLPLRTVPLEISVFTPVASRMTEAHRRALLIQQEAVAAWNEELARRFTDADRSVAITDVALRG